MSVVSEQFFSQLLVVVKAVWHKNCDIFMSNVMYMLSCSDTFCLNEVCDVCCEIFCL